MATEKGCLLKVEEKSLQDEERKAENGLPSLLRNHRVKKKSEFREIFRSGERRTGDHLTIIFVKGRGFKFGITFQREAKPAVKRNRAKRRLTEMIRGDKALFANDIHMVIHVRKSGIDLSFQELEAEFRCLVEKAGIST
jgi:ribonuclease P protein component